MSDIKGISPSYCTHKILMEDDFKPVIQPQRRLNQKVQDVVKNDIVKLLDSGLIYPISDSSWVSLIHVVPKKGGMSVVLNDNNELIPSRTVTRWRVCIDYPKLNDATQKDHFPLPFIDQMSERLCGNEYYCYLDAFLGFFQIPITPEDQEKTTFICPYGTFAYRRMPFGLCNAPTTFQRCMTAIFQDMVEDFMEVFMDDFSVFDNRELHKLTTKNLPRINDLIDQFQGSHYFSRIDLRSGYHQLRECIKKIFQIHPLGRVTLYGEHLCCQEEGQFISNVPRLSRVGLADHQESPQDRRLARPVTSDVRTLMMDEAHASRYLVNSGADKTYYDLRDMYGGHVWRRILLPMLAIV
ncbi:putative reverse transcriptase domain-containing protein [Tanacetum coccineum]|uniref:Reverse transcriptase domain-containing protein n=1 Tax=Tanacetum coccineum TaxID=301880 RepID=A0ABQ5F1X4_9ASTR